MVHRRPLGNGRRLAIVGSILVMIGCVLPWYVLGGDGGLPEQVYRAFDGTGIVSFLAALATLALVVLPYAAGPRPVAIDRGLAYGLLAIAALAGVALWLPNVARRTRGAAPGPRLRLVDRRRGRDRHGARRVRDLTGAASPLTPAAAPAITAQERSSMRSSSSSPR